MSIKQCLKLKCAICGDKIKKEKITLFKEINVCNNCVYRILTLYVHLNPVWLFCPFCNGKKKKTKCSYCDISKKMELFKYENI
jgi:DNA-directed RNA polymerase subunit RPC12/RpoP